jgi:hypothetical protein
MAQTLILADKDRRVVIGKQVILQPERCGATSHLEDGIKQRIASHYVFLPAEPLAHVDESGYEPY